MDIGDHSRKLITELLERLPEDRQSFICIRGLPRVPGEAVEHRFIACGAERPLEESVEEAAQAVRDLHHQALNVNFNIAIVSERPEQGKGISLDIVTGLFGFFIDLDVAHEAHANGKNYPPTIRDALSCLPFEPTWVFSTGHGLHAVILFEEPHDFSGHYTKDKVAQLSRRFAKAVAARARRKGWDLDSTADFSRGFRLPGTTNFKGGASTTVTRLNPADRPANWSGGEPRREVSEIDDLLADIARYDETAKDLPLSFGQQEWRFDQAYLSLIVAKGRELDPVRLNDLIDSDNEAFEEYQRPCKPKKQRKGKPVHGDTSKRDFKLAIKAAKANFTNQEIADLLIGCRAKHDNDFKRRDYYLRTVWSARESLKNKQDGNRFREPEPECGPAAAPNNDDEILASLPERLRKLIPAGTISDSDLALRLRATRKLSKGLEVKSTKFVPQIPVSLVLVLGVNGDEVTHTFHFSDGGSVSEMEFKSMSDRKYLVWGFQNAGYYIKPPLAGHEAAGWLEGFRDCLSEATVMITADPLRTKAGELRELIEEYCNTAKRIVFERADLKEWPNAILVEKESGGVVWISSAAFFRWLKQTYNRSFSGPDFAKLAKQVGLKRERFHGKLNRMMYTVPDIDAIAVVEAYESRNTNPRSIAREEEDSRVQ